jgi:hypothetical protein
MAITPVSVEAVQELHDYFTANEARIPKSIEITKAERVNDTAWLVNECFAILSDEAIPERIRNMRLDILRRIRAAMEPPVE